jgi:outer membrane lipoprotein-sorting protein
MAGELSANCIAQYPIPAGLYSLSVEELKSEQAKFQRRDQIHLAFKQGIYSTLRKKMRYSDGEAYLAKPALVRWNKFKPREEYIYDGKDLYIHHVDQMSAMKFSSKGSQAKEFESIIEIVLSFDSLLKSYDIVQVGLDRNLQEIFLRASPKKPSDLLEVLVKYSKTNGAISNLCLEYKEGKLQTYDFSFKESNKFSHQVFRFEAPKGVKLEVYD